MITSITRKPDKVFLATLLVAGIIAIFSQSFMIGAHAQQYGMYNYKDPRVDVEKFKCNNDNFNIDVTNPEVLSQVADKINYILERENADAGDSQKISTDPDIVLICTNDNSHEVTSTFTGTETQTDTGWADTTTPTTPTTPTNATGYLYRITCQLKYTIGQEI